MIIEYENDFLKWYYKLIPIIILQFSLFYKIYFKFFCSPIKKFKWWFFFFYNEEKYFNIYLLIIIFHIFNSNWTNYLIMVFKFKKIFILIDILNIL